MAFQTSIISLETSAIYGDRPAVIDFYAGIAIITGFYLPHSLTDQSHQRIDYTIVVYILEEGLDDLIHFVDDIMRLSM